MEWHSVLCLHAVSTSSVVPPRPRVAAGPRRNQIRSREWRESLRDRAAEVQYLERLIEDVQADTAELSGAISDYYWWHEDTEDRVEARRSGFPRLAYTLVLDVPSETPAGPSNGSGGLTVSAAGLREAIRSGELHRASRAELNFTGYLMAVTENLIEIASELITFLESYLGDRRN